MAIRPPSQFEQLTERLGHLERLLMQVIHMLGPRLDQESLRTGMADVDLDFLGPEEGIWEPEDDLTEAYLGEIRGEEPPEVPRTRVAYKTNQGGEAFVEWNSLEPDMQMVIEIARQSDDPWQLYESPAGQMRIYVSSEVAAAAQTRKQGSHTVR